MKKYCFYLILFLLPTFSNAQFAYSIDFVGSADYTDFDQSQLGPDVELKFDFRIGGNFNVRLFHNAYIKTGLRYAQTGFCTFIGDLRWPSEFGPNGWEPDSSLPRYYNNSIDLNFLEIPLIGRYQFGGAKWNIYTEFGAAANIYLKSRATSTSSLGKVTSNMSSRNERIMLTYIVGIGANMRLTNSLQLFIQPTARIYHNQNPDLTHVNMTKRSYGVEFGLRRALNLERESIKN